MKRTVFLILLLCGLASFLSCGSSYPSGGGGGTTIYPHRALISNLTSSRIDIADTSRDLLVTAISGDTPGLLLLSSDKKFTLALSPIDNSLGLIENSNQTVPGSGSLAGPSKSMVLTVDDGTILAAVPTEPGPVGQAPGAVDVVSVAITTSGTTTSATLTRQPSIPLPGARFLAASPNTNAVVAMSDSVPNPANPGGPLGRVWVILTSLVNSNNQPYQEAATTFWDHPVFAVGSTNNNSAYVLNCGLECGGTQASIVRIDFPTLPNQPPIVVGRLPIPGGATVGLISGTTLYVAGTVAGIGTLTTVDLPSFTVTGSVAITDGYHNHMTLGSNNQLFVGARDCTIVPRDPQDPTKGRGCLTLVETTGLKVKFEPPTPFTPPAPDPGDNVTGMTPIANRNEVYVIQGGELVIYDTTTLAQKVQDNPPNIIGQGVDIVAVDF